MVLLSKLGLITSLNNQPLDRLISHLTWVCTRQGQVFYGFPVGNPPSKQLQGFEQHILFFGLFSHLTLVVSSWFLLFCNISTSEYKNRYSKSKGWCCFSPMSCPNRSCIPTVWLCMLGTGKTGKNGIIELQRRHPKCLTRRASPPGGGQMSRDALWLWQFNDPGTLRIRLRGESRDVAATIVMGYPWVPRFEWFISRKSPLRIGGSWLELVNWWYL